MCFCDVYMILQLISIGQKSHSGVHRGNLSLILISVSLCFFFVVAGNQNTICICFGKQRCNTGSCHTSYVQIAMVERPEEERDGQRNAGSRVSQAHPSPWPCSASSQDACVSDNTRLKLLQFAGLFPVLRRLMIPSALWKLK